MTHSKNLIYKKLLLTTVLATTVLFSSTGEELTKVNGCMECHNIMGAKEAPAFTGTAKKNIKWFGTNAQDVMNQSIKNGSKGKYGKFTHTAMPAYNHLNDEELNTITSWILDEYEKNRGSNNNMNNNKGRGQGQGQRKGQGRM